MASKVILGQSLIDILFKMRAEGGPQVVKLLETTRRNLGKIQTTSRTAMKSIEDFGTRMDKASIALGIGGIVLKKAGMDILTFSASFVKAAAELESGLVEVSKTTDISGDKLRLLGEEFKNLSSKLPVSTKDMTQIAAKLGQLGIASGLATDKAIPLLVNLTETIVKLATATDLSTEQAVLGIGKLGKAFGVPADEMDDTARRLADTLNELGNTTAASASQIVAAMLKASASATTLGMTLPDLAAVSAVLIQMGFDSSRAGTLFRSALIKMARRAEELREIFGVVVTDETFKSAKGLEGMFTQLNKRMKEMGETESLRQLSKIVDIRAFGILAKLASATEKNAEGVSEFGKALEAANKQFDLGIDLSKESGSVTIEYAKVLATFNSQWEMLTNTVNNLMEDLGSGLLPMLTKLVAAINKVLVAFRALPAPIKRAIGVTIGSVTALIGSVLLLGGTVSAMVATTTFAAGGLGRIREALAAAGLSFGVFNKAAMDFKVMQEVLPKLMISQSGIMNVFSTTMGQAAKRFKHYAKSGSGIGAMLTATGAGMVATTKGMKGIGGAVKRVAITDAKAAQKKFKLLSRLISKNGQFRQATEKAFEASITGSKDYGLALADAHRIMSSLTTGTTKQVLTQEELNRTISLMAIEYRGWARGPQAQSLKNAAKLTDIQTVAKRGLRATISDAILASATWSTAQKKLGQHAIGLGVFGQMWTFVMIKANAFVDKFLPNFFSGIKAITVAGGGMAHKIINFFLNIKTSAAAVWKGIVSIISKVGWKLAGIFKIAIAPLGALLVKLAALAYMFVAVIKFIKGFLSAFKGIKLSQAWTEALATAWRWLGIAIKWTIKKIMESLEAFVNFGKAVGKLIVGLGKFLGILEDKTEKAGDSAEKSGKDFKNAAEALDTYSESAKKAAKGTEELISRFQRLALPAGFARSFGTIRSMTAGETRAAVERSIAPTTVAAAPAAPGTSTVHAGGNTINITINGAGMSSEQIKDTLLEVFDENNITA